MLTFLGKREAQFSPIDIGGKTWAAVGDSITEGTGVSLDSERYTELLSAEKSLTLTNLGESGQTLTTNEYRTGLSTKLGTAYGKDLITILAGTNDWFFDIPLGSNLDSDTSTIKSTVNYFIDQIRANSPSSIILFILTTYRSKNQAGNEVVSEPTNNLGLTLEDYNNAIKEVCIIRQVRYLNLYDIPSLEASAINTWSDDGLHPNVTGNINMKNVLSGYFL